MFAATPVVTVRTSVDALRLKLWDEERGALVPFSALRRSAGGAADPAGPAAATPKPQ